MIKYLRYYFSKEGQRNANEHWKANGVLMHDRHEHETHLANIEWQNRKDKEDAEIAAFVLKVKSSVVLQYLKYYIPIYGFIVVPNYGEGIPTFVYKSSILFNVISVLSVVTIILLKHKL